ncbi:MAG: cell division protein FtsA [Candidatus Pacebacteria bacterium]|nr:cell division protein FtsA [Candidatus Paceibacterota bacterium]
MAKTQIVTGIDIGTDTIKLLIVRKDVETGKIVDVLFFDKIDSLGIQKGRIKSPQEVGKRIKELLSRAQERKVPRSREIFVNINGNKLELINTRGLISVARADQKVSQEDIDRIFQEARTINLQSTNREIMTDFPKEWILDGEKEIKDPLGLKGKRLELEAFLLSAFSADIENVSDALNQAGIEIEEKNIVPSPLAAVRSVLTSPQKELGVALVDIGAGSSSVVIYEEGKLLNLAVFPVGSSNITNDIAIGFKTEIEVAEKIKREHGSCSSFKGSGKKIEMDISSLGEEEKERVEIGVENEKSSLKKKEVKKLKDDKNKLVFSEKELKKIVEARVCEIFDLINKEIKKVSRQELLPGGIVLTGGGAKLPGIVELAKKEFNLPCRIGYAKDFSALGKDSSLSTVCGLVMDDADEDLAGESAEEEGFGKKIKRFFSNFIP